MYQSSALSDLTLKTGQWALALFSLTEVSPVASPCSWCSWWEKVKKNLPKAMSFEGRRLKTVSSKPSVLKPTYSAWGKFSSFTHLKEIKNCYILGTEFIPLDPDRPYLEILALLLTLYICWGWLLFPGPPPCLIMRPVCLYMPFFFPQWNLHWNSAD